RSRPRHHQCRRRRDVPPGSLCRPARPPDRTPCRSPRPCCPPCRLMPRIITFASVLKSLLDLLRPILIAGEELAGQRHKEILDLLVGPFLMDKPAGNRDETVVSTRPFGAQFPDQLTDGGPHQPVVFLKKLAQPKRRLIGLAANSSRTATCP